MRLILITVVLFFSFCGLRAQQVQHQKKGVASYYAHKFDGRKTATGEVFDNHKFTAACNKLKLGTYVKVTNTENGNVVYVRINDRMAATNRRLIDLAKVAAEKLDFKDDGLAKVKIEIVPEDEGQNCILAQNDDAEETTHKNTL